MSEVIIGALPGVAAAALSSYNWYQMRRGAVLKPDITINYGLEITKDFDGSSL